MSKEDIKLLLVRYITNQATQKEAQQVKEWIALHPENELYFIDLYEAWQNMLSIRQDVIDEDLAFELFQHKVLNKKKRGITLKQYCFAALLTVAISFGIFLQYHHAQSKADQVSIVAAKGVIKKISLTDGTQIWLNAGSSVQYDTGFGKTNRNISLQGEALFDIGHQDKRHPFILKTKNYIIRDIGTRFNVKAYANDAYLEAMVLQGEIAVTDNSSSSSEHNRFSVKSHQLLKINYQQLPNDENYQLADVSSKKINDVQMAQVDSSKTNIYDGWKDNLLVFDGTTLADLTKVLERRYNVNISLQSKELESIRYSGSFQDIPDIQKVLDIIKQNTPIDYRINHNNIILTKTDN